MLPGTTATENSAGTPLLDRLGRPLRSLRVSVTDRCNLRCNYCMPQEEYVWLPREELLSFEEIARLVEVFTSLGVEDVRLTGGEPLLRRDLPRLVRLLAANPRIRDLALTRDFDGLEAAVRTFESRFARAPQYSTISRGMLI